MRIWFELSNPARRILGKWPANFSRNFSSEFFLALFLQGFRPPPKNSHPKSLAFLSNFKFGPDLLSRRFSACGGEEDLKLSRITLLYQHSDPWSTNCYSNTYILAVHFVYCVHVYVVSTCYPSSSWRVPLQLGTCTMRAEIVAYMIYLEGPEYPEYAMHVFT